MIFKNVVDNFDVVDNSVLLRPNGFLHPQFGPRLNILRNIRENENTILEKLVSNLGKKCYGQVLYHRDEKINKIYLIPFPEKTGKKPKEKNARKWPFLTLKCLFWIKTI